MTKKISIYDIAKTLGMSTSTVSRALNDNSAISDATRTLVKQTAKQMNYVPNTFAVNLKRGRTDMIGVLVPYIARNFFSAAIEGIEQEAYKLGYDVLICQSGDMFEREKHILNALSRGKVDGVIASLAADTHHYDHYKSLSRVGIPLVLFDRTADGIGDARVVADDYRGAYDMVQHLISQGRRRIFHYGGAQHVSVWRDRYRGYCDALSHNGIDPEQGWFTQGAIHRENGIAYAREIMEFPIRPDAIFCSSDYVALGMIMEFERMGIRVPSDIAVAGFANEDFGELIKPSLSSVNQFSREMGSTACTLLMSIFRGEKVSDVVLAPEVIIRSSTICRD